MHSSTRAYTLIACTDWRFAKTYQIKIFTFLITELILILETILDSFLSLSLMKTEQIAQSNLIQPLKTKQ